MYEDKVLVCKVCGEEFVFTAGEQEFYAEKGFENEPGRCPACRAARKQRRGAEMGERQMYDAVCADCGAECQVPFRPSGDRPVYCRECFQARRANAINW
ncbi:MAG TPA: zinc-ribbon domain containing protein [Bacillota bacterium]|nr:zinc-ribbon domain containing protein [Bacillota bacterium]